MQYLKCMTKGRFERFDPCPWFLITRPNVPLCPTFALAPPGPILPRDFHLAPLPTRRRPAFPHFYPQMTFDKVPVLTLPLDADQQEMDNAVDLMVLACTEGRGNKLDTVIVVSKLADIETKMHATTRNKISCMCYKAVNKGFETKHVLVNLVAKIK